MTHSPFPWSTNSQIPTSVFDAEGKRIVDPYFAMDPDVAADNAALIAALPKLVEALEPLVAIANAVFAKYETTPGQFREAYCEEPDGRPVWGFNRTDLTYGHLRAARAALASIGK